MKKYKRYLGIDASSNAIGISLIKTDDEKIVSVESTTIYPDKDKTSDTNERIKSIIKNFEIWWGNNMSRGHFDFLGEDSLAILNVGYMPSNGIDKSVDALKMVEYYIKLKLLFNFENRISVLDSSWTNRIFDPEEIKKMDGKKIKRSEKKAYTVKYVSQYILKDGYKYNHDLTEVSKVKGNVYEIYYKDGEGTVMSKRITDDEADSIACVLAYHFGIMDDSTVLSRKEKTDRKKIDTLTKEVSALTRKLMSLKTKIEKNKKEIAEYSEKQLIKKSTVNLNAIKNREIKNESLLIEYADHIAMYKTVMGQVEKLKAGK